jgi:hypothetical protein
MRAAEREREREREKEREREDCAIISGDYCFYSVFKRSRMQLLGVDETVYYFSSVLNNITVRLLGVDVTIAKLDK